MKLSLVRDIYSLRKVDKHSLKEERVLLTTSVYPKYYGSASEIEQQYCIIYANKYDRVLPVSKVFSYNDTYVYIFEFMYFVFVCV